MNLAAFVSGQMNFRVRVAIQDEMMAGSVNNSPPSAGAFDQVFFAISHRSAAKHLSRLGLLWFLQVALQYLWVDRVVYIFATIVLFDRFVFLWLELENETAVSSQPVALGSFDIPILAKKAA